MHKAIHVDAFALVRRLFTLDLRTEVPLLTRTNVVSPYSRRMHKTH